MEEQEQEEESKPIYTERKRISKSMQRRYRDVVGNKTKSSICDAKEAKEEETSWVALNVQSDDI